MIKEFFPNGGEWGHKWCKFIHGFRKQWSSAWVKNHYTAGMVSTQLVESCNATVRGFLTADKTMVEFFPHFDRMVESRRRAEREAEYASRNSHPLNNYEYSAYCKKAATQYTPKMFAIFQEQYARIQEYELEPITTGEVSDSSPRQVSYLCYKMHGNERLDDRVVKVEPGDGIVSCDCRWWDTIGILCRHSLTVMHMLGTFGNAKFKTLDQRYIKDRWTRSAKRNLVSLIIPRPLTRGEESEQRYTRIFAKFGFIIRAALPILEVSEMVEVAGDALAEQVKQALALYEAPRGGVNTFSAGNEATPPATSRIGKKVATKFPKQPKPSKNSKRMKGIVELSRMKERNKFKRKRAKEAAIQRAGEASRLQDSLAAIFDNNQTVTSFPSFTELLQSQESVNRRC
ncbi:Protein FAR1-RELATED SEQUENCE 5 [Linum perenne]